MEHPLNRIVYVTGTHGSGKSMLIDNLVKAHPDIYELIPRIPIPRSQEIMERIMIRHFRYYLHTFYEKEWSQQHPDKIGLRDRCTVDEHTYTRGFLKIGWLTQQQFDNFLLLDKLMFTSDKMPRNILFVNTPVPLAIENIKGRWAAGEPKKWMEDKFYYLAAVHEAFEEYLATYDGNVLNLQATDLEERVKICHDWVNKTIRNSDLRLRNV